MKRVDPSLVDRTAGSFTRRQFLQHSGLVAGSLGAGANIARAMVGVQRTIPLSAKTRRTTPQSWLPTSSDEDQFRTLGLVAMDAAKQAGADFADIRIGAWREFDDVFSVSMAQGYGIRACVNGVWSFAHGAIFTSDAVAAVARSAVASARVAARLDATLGSPASTVLAKVPVVTGEWRSPVEIDPFAVPIDEYIAIQMMMGGVVRRFGSVRVSAKLRWLTDTRTFVSTEGTIVTQTFTRGGPSIIVSAWIPGTSDVRSLSVPGCIPESAGFEAVLRPTLLDRIVATAEELIRWTELPIKFMDDVGRFPVVFDGSAFAAIVGQTLNFALDADRISGTEADASGRSFLRPLNTTTVSTPASAVPDFSPLLTVTSHRSVPSGMAARWDDEGVATAPATIVEQGRVTGFHTTRDTAPLFESWYRRQKQSGQPHGACVAPTPVSIPMASGGDMQVAPGPNGNTTLTMAKDIKLGILVMDAFVQETPGLSAGVLIPRLSVEIVNGKPTACLSNVRMTFKTHTLLNSGLTTLGDKGTVQSTMAMTNKGMPWQTMVNPVSAPAAYCQEISVLRASSGRR